MQKVNLKKLLRIKLHVQQDQSASERVTCNCTHMFPLSMPTQKIRR